MTNTRRHIPPAALVAASLVLATATAHGQGAIGHQVGVAAGVTGPVQLIAAAPGARAAGRNVQSGEVIRIGDRIATGPDGRLQIMLLDETIFTIGPNAALTIDEFVFDSRNGNGKVAATVARGAFRFVTGRIAANNPQDMQVKTPVGTMGIRGTVVGGWVREDRAKIVLLGPGSQNNAAERMGRVFVTGNGQGDGGVELRRPGFATEIVGPNGQPTTPFRLPQAEIEALIAELSNPLNRSANAMRGGGEGASEEELAELAPAAGSGLLGDNMTRLSGQHIIDFLRPLICPSCTVILDDAPGSATGAPASGAPGRPSVGDVPPLPTFGPRPTVGEIATFRGAVAFPSTSFSLVSTATGAASGRYDVTATFDFDTKKVTGELMVVFAGSTDRIAFTGVVPSTLGTAAAARSFAAAPSSASALGPSGPTPPSVKPAPGTVSVPLFDAGVRQSGAGWVEFRYLLEKSPGTLAVDRLANGMALSRFGAPGSAPLATGGGIARTDGTTVPLTEAERAKLMIDLGLKR